MKGAVLFGVELLKTDYKYLTGGCMAHPVGNVKMRSRQGVLVGLLAVVCCMVAYSLYVCKKEGSPLLRIALCLSVNGKVRFMLMSLSSVRYSQVFLPKEQVLSARLAPYEMTGHCVLVNVI